MKKILSLLAIATISTPCVSAVNACGFKESDLSSWGSSQKSTIVKEYLQKAASYKNSTWANWIVDGFSVPESMAVLAAFQKINKKINNQNIARDYTPMPSLSETVKAALAKGVKLVVEALKDTDISGQITVDIKGNI